MQIPPLDLKQVEIVKGSSSTLYGGGAIAGIVNLVTKEPTQERELTLLANGTTAGGLDLNGFYSQKFGKAGLTLYAARNSQAAYDPNKDGFSDIPKSDRYTINPRFFYDFSSKTKLNLGVNFATEKRVGGDLSGIKGETGTFYTEENQSFQDQHYMLAKLNGFIPLQKKIWNATLHFLMKYFLSFIRNRRSGWKKDQSPF